MSNELDKIKHSERRHRTQNVISKQMKIAKAKHVIVDEPHKLAKHHALDCGVSNCPLCSSPRKRGELTIQEKRFYQKVDDE
jgi:hypothetical protein